MTLEVLELPIAFLIAKASQQLLSKIELNFPTSEVALLNRIFFVFWMLHTISYGSTSEQAPESTSPEQQASETNDPEPSSLERIESKIEAEDQRQKEIESKEALARQQVRDAVTQADRSLAEAQLALEAYRLNLSKVTDSHLRQLQSIIAKYRSTRQELEQFSNSLNESQLSEEEAYKLYQKIRELWVEIIDDGFEIYRLAYHQEIPALLSPAPESLINQASADKKKQYQTTWDQARQEYESLSQSRVDVFRLKSQEYFNLLGQVSAARARSMELLGWKDLYLKEGENYLDDIVREVLAIPVKFFGIAYKRVIEFQSYLSNGLAGAWDLLNNLCLLLFLFTIPWLARKTTQWIIRQLDFYRAKVLKLRFRKDQMNYRWALRIQRATPYIPLLLYIMVLEFVAVYIEGTFYGELRFLLPLLRYYLVYKVFRLAIEDTISLLQGVVSINPTEVRRLVDFTSKLVGRFYLISFSTMALTVATVDKGLIYNLTSIVLQGLGLIIWALAIHRWKGVLSPAVKSLFPGKVGQFLGQQCLGRFSVLYCLPTFILVFIKILIGAFWDIMEEWEVTKIFFAKIYRRRVEALDSKTSPAASEPPPETYSKLFSLDFQIEAEQTVDANAKQLEQVEDEIRKWLQEDEGDQSLVIYGEKGIGKTSFMRRLSQDFQELDHYFMDTPAKTLDLESLNAFISESLGLNSTDSLERKIMNFNHSLEKKVIIFLDNAHNLFLGEVGGFVALKALIDLVNLDSKNIFWCVSFNEFSWSYLKGVLGNAEYFRTEVYLNGWSDSSIRKLIMSRHNLSKYKLSFDRLVLALRNTTTQSGAIEYAEEQFFRLLWEQSRGNPRVALHLWVRSLTLLRKDSLKVNLPERIKTDRLKTMDDNVWFILAAVTNHENASRGEIADATNLSLGTVNHAIKLALEERFLHRDQQRRYRLGLTFQHDLIKNLKEKNFIYGLN